MVMDIKDLSNSSTLGIIESALLAEGMYCDLFNILTLQD